MRRLIASILLGGLTTLALAWALAALVPVPMYPRRTARTWMSKDGAVWSANEVFPIGVHDMWWMRVSDDPIATPDQWLARLRAYYKLMEADRRGTDGHMRAIEAPPAWGTPAHRPPGPAETGAIGSDTAFGWPLPCLWYTVRASTMETATGSTLVGEQLVGGLALRGTPSARVRSFRALPLLPIWPALFLDTIVWTIAWVLILTIPLALRRRARRRRGRCASCGYALVGIAAPKCSECGAAQAAEGWGVH